MLPVMIFLTGFWLNANQITFMEPEDNGSKCHIVCAHGSCNKVAEMTCNQVVEEIRKASRR